MTESQPTRALAAFAAQLDPAGLPAEVRRKLGELLLDHLRVCSVGGRLSWSGWARKYVGAVGKAGPSHVLFSNETLNPQHAVYLNTTYGSSFDADDTHVGAMLHPGVSVWSSALAMAEQTGAPGSEVAAAAVAGYETMIRLGLSMQPSHFRRGFQSTGTCGTFGTAAAASRILFRGADAEARTLDAIALAGGYSSGVAQYYYSGASGKRIQAPHAAQNGVAATLLAAEGFGGPADLIEGQRGFARAYADEWDFSIIEDGLGSKFYLMDVLVKSYAAAARVHAAIDGMFALRQAHGFSADDIAEMRLGIPSIIQGPLTKPHPVDLQAAQMCLPFSVAVAAGMALVPGRTPIVTVDAYEAGMKDPRLFALEDRMTIEVDEDVEKASNKYSTGAKLTLTLRDGRKLEEFVPQPKGSALNPFAPGDHARRFTEELSTRVPESVCAEIVDMAMDLDRLDARRLGALLSGA